MRYLGLVAGLALVAAAAHPVLAAPTSTIQNTYWGGLDTYYGYSPSAANGNSIGGVPYTINSASASRINNQVSVTINTSFAGDAGTMSGGTSDGHGGVINPNFIPNGNSDGVGLGDLLLNTTQANAAANKAYGLSLETTTPWRASQTTVSQLLGNWQYGAAGDVTTGTQLNSNGSTSTASKDWNTATVNDDSIRNASNASYWTNISAATNTTNMLGDIWQSGDWHYAVTDGASGWGLYAIDDSEIVLSHAPGCTNTYPIQSNCDWFYRAGEAVAVTGTVSSQFIESASVDINAAAQTVTYSINDSKDILGVDFAMSWAMTCANDIIQGEFNVPAPGSLALLLVGLIGIGAARRRRVCD